MAIIDTLNEAQFVDEFRKIRKDNFSYDGLRLLFRYLEDLSEDLGEDIEFYPVSFCWEFSEYSLEEFNADYNANIKSFEDFDIEKHEDDLNANNLRILEIFTARDFVDGERISEEKVLVQRG